MLRLWPPENRIGICPGRLVLADRVIPVAGDLVSELGKINGKSRLTVVLSNHLVRYAVLPWSPELTSSQEWLAFARHTFASVYGSLAAGWEIRLATSRRGAARIATAVDGALLSSLRALPGLVSVQPYLMSAFNVDRHRVGDSAWLVLHESGRITLALITENEWRLVRSRQVHDAWPESLLTMLARETITLDGTPPNRVFVRSEQELPEQLGAYVVTDLMRHSRTAAPNAQAMVFH